MPANLSARPSLAGANRERRLIECHPDWPRFAGESWADSIFDVEVTDREHRKQGRAIARWTLTDGAETCVVFLKRHFVLPRLHGLMARVFPKMAWSPGLQEWRNLQTAEALGIPVPRTMAAGQYVDAGCRVRGFLASEELHDMLALHEAIPLAYHNMQPMEYERWKRGLITEMARLSRRLHDAHYFHQDLYLCHFYIPRTCCLAGGTPAQWSGQMVMIDFHRLSHTRLRAPWAQVKDLAQLLYSTHEDGITDRDRLRFARAYGLGTGTIARLTRRLVILKAARYRNHNRKAGG